MKKTRHDNGWRHNHNLHLARMKVRFRNIKRRKRKLLQGISKVERERIRVMKKYANYTKITAPRVFSLIQNPSETLEFVTRLEDCFNSGKKVFVRMRNVEILGEGALVVLLSSLINFKANKLDFNGDFPKHELAKRRLVESGFFNELYQKSRMTQKDSYNLSNRSIFTHASKIVDAHLSATLIGNISKKIWGSERRCLGVQRAYIELMQNTNNHASIHSQGEHHWWTTVSYDNTRRVACFAFLDYGVGIIKSITTDPKSKLHKVINLFKNLFNSKNDSELLELLLKGEIHKAGRNHSSTKQYFRGKGLPGIYEACNSNHLSNLVVISNKAMAEVSRNKYTLLEKNFSGTFVYWEVKHDNINLPICN